MTYFSTAHFLQLNYHPDQFNMFGRLNKFYMMWLHRSSPSKVFGDVKMESPQTLATGSGQPPLGSTCRCLIRSRPRHSCRTREEQEGGRKGPCRCYLQPLTKIAKLGSFTAKFDGHIILRKVKTGLAHDLALVPCVLLTFSKRKCLLLSDPGLLYSTT